MGAIELQLIGPLVVRREGMAQPLPPSRKTRALLSYLAISGRPERRERLCELFWDTPDDPKGALQGIVAFQLHSGGPMEVRYKDFEVEVNPAPQLKTAR